jgi:hypothetical protein
MGTSTSSRKTRSAQEGTPAGSSSGASRYAMRIPGTRGGRGMVRSAENQRCMFFRPARVFRAGSMDFLVQLRVYAKNTVWKQRLTT